MPKRIRQNFATLYTLFVIEQISQRLGYNYQSNFYAG